MIGDLAKAGPVSGKVHGNIAFEMPVLDSVARALKAGASFPIRPIGDRVAVLIYGRAGEISGILIPESAKPKGDRGVVTAAGPRCQHLKPGDVVILPKHSGEDVVYDGRKYAILRELECLAVVEGGKLP